MPVAVVDMVWMRKPAHADVLNNTREMKMPNCTLKTTVAVILSALLALVPVVAYPVSMQEMFNGMSNTTPAGAYHGQTQNVYSGGSVSMRVPQKNYQLYSYSPPSVSGGCGGIDAFAGSFSYINSQNLVNALQNIGSAALSQAFFMAIDSMSPMVGVNLKQLMDKLQKATNQSINSCEAGKLMANTMLGDTPKKMNKWASENALDFTVLNNIFADRAEAQQGIGADDVQLTNNVNAAAAAGHFPLGNLVWNALAMQNQNAIGDDTVTEFEARLIMSLVGTTIVLNSPSDAAAGKQAQQMLPVAPLISAERLENFIGLDTVQSTTLAGFQVYSCRDGDADQKPNGGVSADPNPALVSIPTSLQCIGMTPADVSTAGGAAFKSMRALVHERLISINDALLNDQAISATDKAFINSTSVPVYKMLAVSNAVTKSGLGIVMINNNEAVIAAQYADAYINGLFDVLNKALTKYSPKAGDGLVAAIKDIRHNVTEVRKSLAVQLGNAHQNQVNVNHIAGQIMQMEQMMMASLPNNISGAMSMRRMKGGH